MAPTNFEKAEADRLSIKDHLEFLDTELTRHNSPTPLIEAEVDMYMAELDETRKLLGPNHSQLRLFAAKTADMAPFVAEYRNLSQLASRLFSGFYGIKRTFPITTAATTAPTPSSTQSIKLPPLELPKFNGNLQEWVSFRDLFVTAVHNSSLTKVEKLTQLKALLTGEAARQVRSLVLSEANYDIAWKSLQDRYENNRELLFSILKRLMNQQIISSSTATNLRSLIDTTKECVRSLEVLTIPIQHWDAILLYIIFSKLDSASKELWEQSLNDTNIPDLSKMYDFLEQRSRALAASSTQQPPRQQVKQQQHQHVRVHHAAPVSALPCKLGCSSAHPLFKCQEFQRQTPPQRNESIKRLKLCFNCLSSGHQISSCTSQHTCKLCNRRHHTMLHLDGGSQQNQPTPPSSSTQSQQQPTVQNHHVYQQTDVKTGILATAKIQLLSPHGDYYVRSLVDPGSTNSNITEHMARKMKLQLHRVKIPMSGLGDTFLGQANYVTTFSFKPYFESNQIFSVTAIVVKTIGSNIPSQGLMKEEWKHINGLQLADPDFHLPSKCDILLGTDISWDLIDFTTEKISGTSGQPVAVKSALGYLIAGSNITSTTVASFNTNITANLDFHLRRFWEQEEIVEKNLPTAEEAACEQHFASTHRRDSTGRFIVELPFKTQVPDLGDSKQQAIRRFISMERKFADPRNVKDSEQLRKIQQQWNDYKAFMAEYEELGHMSLVPPAEIDNKHNYYIPHHSVLKESSTTTKLRVVFDASAASTNGKSLNQCQMVGPTLQDNIWDILLRFRIHQIAFTADICKMYRQIRVAQKHVDYQRIVWRENPSLPLRFYRLLTVTYGETSAPYLAIKCLQQLAKDEEKRFPLASKVALRDFYVDDNASGCNTLEEAKTTVQQLISLCMSGGFELRKWTTNSPELLNTIPEDLRETSSLVELQEDSTIKTLGIFWNPTTDKYSFRLNLPPDMPGVVNKRNILSEIAKIYDPLGWLSPVIIVCKIFMQDLWKLKCDWDEELPQHIQQQWKNTRDSLQDIEKIEIFRCVIPSSFARIYLVGASDASIKAISASIYICSVDDNGISTCQLLTSKTKVAPVNHVTLPRLELNGAVLLSELLLSTLNALQINFTEIRAFTDSTIALHWITSEPGRWKTYVRNRVQIIQNNIPTAKWYHISGDSNPADCASRGISPLELLHHPLWWTGAPAFFNPTASSTHLLSDEITLVESESQVRVHHAQPALLPELFLKYSSFLKLQRVIAYVIRFCNNWIRPRYQTPIQEGSLTVHELITAHNFILRLLQQSCFSMEHEALSKMKQLPLNNNLLKLKPFVSHDGLLRVGGRLRNAEISYQRKHPILLPKGHFLTSLIIQDIHLRNYHSGPAATLAILQQQYWVVNGRDTIRAVVRKCVACTRHRATSITQVMGDLPHHRVNPARPFSKVGVDYAGPIAIKPMIRSKISLKCWLSIFVCLTTRAIHIEVVSSLSTDCFLAAFRRFISRRGKPSDVFSDCGTNFKGADKVLRDFFLLSRQNAIQDEFANQQVTWHFNPPGAPHFGGLWEAGVKSIKYHLVRVMGSSVLTYEEMHTLVTQVEGILNSRPLIAASADPSDLGVITPGHFLIGAPLTSLPEPDLSDKKENLLHRWHILQQRQQLFWKRWSNEYLSRMQQRPKWMKQAPELQVGHLVIIKDERSPPLKWKMGRVTSVHPGADGHVRVATVKTSDGEIKRPVVKLCLLPIS